MPKLRITATLLLWIPAAALFGWGYILDESQWTAAHGFASNILAAATSGLLGLPVAAIVVQWILRQDADSRRRREIVKDARSNLAIMQSTIESSGIEKVRRLEEVIKSASFDFCVLPYIVRGADKSHVPLFDSMNASLLSLNDDISTNLPNNAEDTWRFRPALRRWEVFRQTVLMPAETEKVPIMSDDRYQTVSQNFSVVETEDLVWLPDLMREIGIVAGMLSKRTTDGSPVINGETVREVDDVDQRLRNLSRQLTARVDLYDEIVTAREVADKLSPDS